MFQVYEGYSNKWGNGENPIPWGRFDNHQDAIDFCKEYREDFMGQKNSLGWPENEFVKTFPDMMVIGVRYYLDDLIYLVIACE
jgi:hypothetical protein